MSGEKEQLHTAVMVAPAAERRTARKARRQAAARLQAEQVRVEREAAKAKAAAEREERKSTTFLPAAGEAGRAALRSPGRLRVPRHQDTSATLAGAYPFMAEGGLGSDGVFVGQDLYSGGSFVYDPWVLYARGIITAPNLVLAGIVGSGKSSLAKSLYTRSLPFGRRVYVPGDPKGEHTAVAEAVGGKAIVLGHGLHTRLNPLDEGHRPGGLTDQEWAATVASRRRDLIGALAETVLARGLTSHRRSQVMPKIPVLRHRHSETDAVPVVLPHVVIVVTEPDTLTVTIDGTPHLPSDGQSWGRSDFGAVLDEITGHRSISVRIEVIETDGSHFTDIIGAHRPRRTAPLSDTIEPADETPQPSRVGGFLPGETVALAPVTTHLTANDTGTINLDPGSGGPVLVFGMSSGTTVMWEPA